MELNQLQYHWNGMGEEDPLFAVLTNPSKQNNRWQREEFLETGRANIAAILQQLSESGLSLKHGRALDFGCAVGRLTQALCDHFDEVDGVDIAPSMLQVARDWNQHGERCRYHLNEVNSLRLFDDQSFDFICTMITLQHMQPKFAVEYIAEFARVLAPGGALFFQVPDQLISLPFATQTAAKPGLLSRISQKLRKLWTGEKRPFKASAFHMEMYCMPETYVVPLLRSLGLNVVAVAPNGWSGPHYVSKSYLAQRPLAAESREPVCGSSDNLARAA